MTPDTLHPLALELYRRLQLEKENDYIPATVVLPGMPQLMGELRSTGNDELFSLRSNVRLGEGGQMGTMDFFFTADKAVTILFPADIPEKSTILSPH